jgi:hypothetical protein
VSIPGFNLLRNDRFRKRGSGVALYVAKNLNSKCIFNSTVGSAVEILLAEIKFEISHIRQPMKFTQRSFRNIDKSALLASVAYLPWDSIGSLPDANLKVLLLNSLLVALLD